MNARTFSAGRPPERWRAVYTVAGVVTVAAAGWVTARYLLGRGQ
jgi:hypothetical protein